MQGALESARRASPKSTVEDEDCDRDDRIATRLARVARRFFFHRPLRAPPIACAVYVNRTRAVPREFAPAWNFELIVHFGRYG
jgi:hypothetical protein